MGIQEVQGNSKAQAYQKKKKAGQAEGFQESFLQNLKKSGLHLEFLENCLILQRNREKLRERGK